MLTHSNSKRGIFSCVCLLNRPEKLPCLIPAHDSTPAPIVALFHVRGNKITDLFAYMQKL